MCLLGGSSGSGTGSANTCLQRRKASAVIFSKCRCRAVQRDEAAAKPPLPVGASWVGSLHLAPAPIPGAGRCCLRVTCNTPPCSHLGHWDPWAAPACAYLRAALLQFGIPSIAPFRKKLQIPVSVTDLGKSSELPQTFCSAASFYCSILKTNYQRMIKSLHRQITVFILPPHHRQLQCLARGSEECACQ